ncbi:hypothetical protein BU16DRAFT_564406 [Lophium mytilinum]|uniref:Uncharacterized protein n=1 Tax=Lophium mytilinum TaxID=390894 RepID=A0A6A6QHM8_9PEZI|nr:hypothetical protein BU16DRAFT_564406 [Lophium mytilinum]
MESQNGENHDADWEDIPDNEVDQTNTLPTPLDEQVVAAIEELVSDHLMLAEAESCAISEKPKAGQSQTQQKYKDESIRCFKIYSRGPYDFGVTPNADMALKIDIAHNRMVKFGRPSGVDAEIAIGSSWPMQTLWEYYWAAAQMAGVAKEDVGRQLDAEYGVNPIPFLKKATPEQVEARKATFKIKSMKMLREMWNGVPEAREVIPVDSFGEPIWDESKNGEFVLIVVKIDKESGLKEFGSVVAEPPAT